MLEVIFSYHSWYGLNFRIVFYLVSDILPMDMFLTYQGKKAHHNTHMEPSFAWVCSRLYNCDRVSGREHLTTILDNHLEIGKFIIDVLDATTRRCEGGSRDLPPSKGFVT